MTPISDLYQRLFLPHYIINFFYTLSFFVARYVSFRHLDSSSKPTYEMYIYTTLLSLIILKYRSSGSAEEFLSITFVYGKLLNVVMFYLFGKTLWSIIYVIIWVVLFAALPQPTYQGRSEIIGLTTEDLRDIQYNNFKVPKITEITETTHDGKDKKKETTDNDQYWVILFYVLWSNPCRNFESTVAKTSLKYATSNVHFGKIDLEQYPALAEEYNISLSPTSLDLPTLILLKDGKEISRLPQKIRDGSNEDLDKIKSKTLRNAKVTWDRLGWDRSMESIITEFKLESLHKTT
ncbi:15500_t:CDS:2 [Gigaspora margarita]|uniref:15500_t:CDS:1 n=1 Tax=Gigaspora margarita TaxID=4874 RepID=A0ABN7V1H6_GIGMA|nr:15500_t:CDS:2 [Gigaspora margarita]